MKGPRELKRLVATHGERLKRGHWDFLIVFKLERCKKWFNRNKNKRAASREINEDLYTS